MTITINARASGLFVSAIVAAGVLYGARAHGAVLDFEPGSADAPFVFEQLGPYQPNSYDTPDDGADRLAQWTASEWVGMLSGASTTASLYWDGGLEGGTNSPLNLLLPATFDLASFVIAGVYGSQTVAVQGFEDGHLRYSQMFAIDLSPRVFRAAWSAIDELRIVVGDDFAVSPEHASADGFRNWAIDDVIYGEASSNVPAPPALWLLLSGAAVLAPALRRRARRRTG